MPGLPACRLGAGPAHRVGWVGFLCTGQRGGGIQVPAGKMDGDGGGWVRAQNWASKAVWAQRRGSWGIRLRRWLGGLAGQRLRRLPEPAGMSSLLAAHTVGEMTAGWAPATGAATIGVPLMICGRVAGGVGAVLAVRRGGARSALRPAPRATPTSHPEPASPHSTLHTSLASSSSPSPLRPASFSSHSLSTSLGSGGSSEQQAPHLRGGGGGGGGVRWRPWRQPRQWWQRRRQVMQVAQAAAAMRPHLIALKGTSSFPQKGQPSGRLVTSAGGGDGQGRARGAGGRAAARAEHARAAAGGATRHSPAGCCSVL